MASPIDAVKAIHNAFRNDIDAIDAAAYDAKAKELAGLFAGNFKAFPDVPSSVAGAGPRL